MEKAIEIKITFPGGKKVNAEFDGFVVKTDQPVKYGGDNSAPAPLDYFFASIGTCAGFYILSFCEKRKIPTENISLVQHIEYGKTTDGKIFLERIIIEILVPTDFPEKYHNALVKAAESCAVQKTIMNPPKFEIRTAV